MSTTFVLFATAIVGASAQSPSAGKAHGSICGEPFLKPGQETSSKSAEEIKAFSKVYFSKVPEFQNRGSGETAFVREYTICHNIVGQKAGLIFEAFRSLPISERREIRRAQKEWLRKKFGGDYDDKGAGSQQKPNSAPNPHKSEPAGIKNGRYIKEEENAPVYWS